MCIQAVQSISKHAHVGPNAQGSTLREMCVISKLGMPCQAPWPQECTRVEFLQLLGSSFGRKSWVVVGTEALPQSNLRQKQQGDCLGEKRKQPLWKGRRKKWSSSESGGMSALLQPSASSREQTLKPSEHLSPALAAKGAESPNASCSVPGEQRQGRDPIFPRVCLYEVICHPWEEFHTV